MRWQRGSSPEQRIEDAVREYVRSGSTAAVDSPQLSSDAEQLLREIAVEPEHSEGRLRALQLAGWLCLARNGDLSWQQDPPDLRTTVTLLGLLHDLDPGLVSGQLWELTVEFGADPESRMQSAAGVLLQAKRSGTDPLNALVALDRALRDLPVDRPEIADHHLLAAAGWFERHGLTGDSADLVRAVTRGRGTLALTGAEDSRRTDILRIVCASLTRLIEQRETAETAALAVEMCRKLLSVLPVGEKDHADAERSLGGLLVRRFEFTRAVADLDEAVEFLRRGADRERRAGRARPELLRNLVVALHERYRLTRAVEDLEEAMRVLDVAVPLAARRDPALASSLRADLRVLEGQRASAPRRATPRPAPPTVQRRLEEGVGLIEQWKAADDPLCRDRAIELLGPALRELPEDHPDLAVCSGYLGYALLRRYRYGGLDPADLAAAGEAIDRAVRTCRPDSANLTGCLTLQAEAAYCRYQRTLATEDLDTAIAVLRRLLSLAPPSERDYWQALHNLGSHLAVRYERTGALSEADEAVELLRHSLAMAGPSVEDPGYTALLLGETLVRRAHDTQTPHDLDEAQDSLSTALRLLPPGDSRHDRAQELLNTAVRRREEERRAFREAALPVLRRATFEPGSDGCPTVPPEAAAQDARAVQQYQNLLVQSLRTFDRTGDKAALETGIATGRRLLAGLPVPHPERAPAASGLGVLLLRRFEQHGDRKDLDDAIEHLKHGAYGPLPNVQQLRNLLDRPDADMEELRRHFGGQLDALLKLSSPRGNELSALAGAYLRRYEHDGDSADLDEAVRAARRAIAVTPPEDVADRRAHIQALGLTLIRRHQRTGNRADLDRAIDLGREGLAMARRMVSDTDGQLTALGALCNRLRSRYLLAGDVSDLDEAVALGTEAVALTHDGQTEPISRLNLALALWSRSLLRDDPADLDAAIGHAETVADALHASSPQRTHTMLTLANMLATRSERDGTESRAGDAERSLALYREAAQAPTCPADDRLTAAVAWGGFAADRAAAGEGPWQEAADGYAVAVGLLPLTAWRGLARTDRERLLARRSHVAGQAAACAIACGRVEQAVELLDHGRSVLWGQALDTRTDLTALRETHPRLADRLAGLRAALEEGTWTAPEQNAGEQRRRLAQEWEDLLGTVRRLPDFEHFLAPLPFSELTGATAAGPLVLVNVSRYRCDALVVTPGRVTLIPLPDLTADEAQRRTEQYLRALDRLNRPGASPGPSQQTVMATLEWLWDTVAAPVLDSPELAVMPDRRLWWCPTGPLTLLPVHAAGYHDPDDGRENDAVMARVVSSYMPTLRGLIRAKRPSAAADADRRLLVLALRDQPSYAPALRPLPGAQKEAEALGRRFPGRHTVRLDVDATCETALSLLASHSCVHFACHAGQDLADPGAGALYLYDHPLRVSDLARLDLPSAELAVLSACQTALGGTELPNEAIHLAGALLLANFQHVVSTLWTVGDDTARQITDEVYEIVADPELGIDASRTAYALHEAVDRARRRQPYRPIGWASYVHFGP
ncbi:CHAT domain-containing protein [Streptomyces sp. NBC_00365]|uniref:CHAT domain-containing protein n=1 Tax=Streptomyces sp. NBC_00365 TaxID=2975726 RepID=UPI0022569696|nr:CHAT domain-containing protein [Streptomyces sp. NBC_00365]MCX5097326.1 CHAT domain-containing protein [Streptomyces sp. NBC_00365]